MVVGAIGGTFWGDVDASERTLSFVQKVYDPAGTLVQIHEKFPVDKGHRRVEEIER